MVKIQAGKSFWDLVRGLQFTRSWTHGCFSFHSLLWVIGLSPQSWFPPPCCALSHLCSQQSPLLFLCRLRSFRPLSLHPFPGVDSCQGASRSFPRDRFNGAALIPTDDSEEVTAALERSACRRDGKPVRPSVCLFTRVSLHPIWKPLHLVRTITPRPPVSPSLP